MHSRAVHNDIPQPVAEPGSQRPEALENRPKLMVVALDKIDAHPRASRIDGLREDEPKAIAAVLRQTGASWNKHRPAARSTDGRIEVVKGHHRVEAARRTRDDPDVGSSGT